MKVGLLLPRAGRPGGRHGTRRWPRPRRSARETFERGRRRARLRPRRRSASTGPSERLSADRDDCQPALVATSRGGLAGGARGRASAGDLVVGPLPGRVLGPGGRAAACAPTTPCAWWPSAARRWRGGHRARPGAMAAAARPGRRRGVEALCAEAERRVAGQLQLPRARSWPPAPSEGVARLVDAAPASAARERRRGSTCPAAFHSPLMAPAAERLAAGARRRALRRAGRRRSSRPPPAPLERAERMRADPASPAHGAGDVPRRGRGALGLRRRPFVEVGAGGCCPGWCRRVRPRRARVSRSARRSDLEKLRGWSRRAAELDGRSRWSPGARAGIGARDRLGARRAAAATSAIGYAARRGGGAARPRPSRRSAGGAVVAPGRRSTSRAGRGAGRGGRGGARGRSTRWC